MIIYRFSFFALVGLFFVSGFAGISHASLLDIKKVESQSGLEAWLVEDHSIPVIALQFAFRDAGTKNDPIEKQGLARMASNTMDEGAGDLDSQAFQKALQNLSITLRFSANRDHFTGQVKTLTRNKDEAFHLLKLALTAPRFDEEPVGRMRVSNQSRIKSALMDPDWMAARILNDRAFEGHAYALNSGGTLTTLDNITPDDLKAFHKRLGRGALVVSAAGDITAEELAGLLDDIFGDMPEGEKPETESFKVSHKGQTYLYKQDIPQSVIEMVQPGIGRKDPDYQTSQVMNYILGASGFGSRLMEEVREKRGLTYGIYTYFQNYEGGDTMHVTTSTANENVGEVLSIIRQTWEGMRQAPVSDAELADAKSYLLGSLPLSLTSTDSIAGLLLSLQLDNLPIDYLDQRAEEIAKVSQDDVLALAKKILQPDDFMTVLVGQPTDVSDAEIVVELPNAE